VGEERHAAEGDVIDDLLRVGGELGGSAGLAAADAVLEVTGERGLPPPNVDFALAALAAAAGLERGAGEAIFGIARCAGWLAHAIEEYGGGSELRPRPIYVGVPVAPER